jgi:hypothetical protein
MKGVTALPITTCGSDGISRTMLNRTGNRPDGFLYGFL